MVRTIQAIVHEGRIELLEQVALEEGTQVLITVVSNDDDQAFWLGASRSALDDVWDNREDEVYAELLER